MKIHRFETINVVPFIDIMLVLLVIVLTTASFVAKGIIPVDLSQAKSAQPFTPKEELIVTIDAHNQFYFNDKAIEKSEIEAELSRFEPTLPILINVDKQIAFEHFVFFLDLLKQHHYEHIGIMAKE